MREPTILFKSLVGSRSYNLHTDESDYDYRYIQVSSLRDALSPFKHLDTKAKIDGDNDDAIWEFSAFCKYAANGNPSVYEAMYSMHYEIGPDPGADVLVSKLLGNKRKFLDARRVYDAHRGYASAQLKKIHWDDMESMRTRKAIVAYLRILEQGRELLLTGSCNLWLAENSYLREILMSIKQQGFQVYTRQHIEQLMEIRERRITQAFEHTILTTANYAWIEEFVESVYLSLGRDECAR